MNTKGIGVIILVVGLLMVMYSGFTYVTKEKVIDVGPIEVSKEKSHPVQWSPLVGAVLLIGGIVVIATAKK